MAIPHLLRRFVAVTLLSLAALAVLLPASPAQAATPGEEERAFFNEINESRSIRGLPKLQGDCELATTSRGWSGHMARAGGISHDPNLAKVVEMVEPQWRAAGENVGVGYSVTRLHDAFMASSGHRANILNSSYNRVGIGVVHSGGRIWVTVRFLAGPALARSCVPTSTSTSTTSTPPGVKTALTGDFDGDGFDDLLAYNPGTTKDELWFGDASGTMRRASVNIVGQFRPVAADFDGDGRTDILWYAPGSATDYRWEWDGTGWVSQKRSINGTYRPLVGDFDGDAVDDLLWYAPGSPSDYYWYGDESGSYTNVKTNIQGTYAPIVGDLDGNGGDDVFWYGAGTKKDYIWYSTLARGSFVNEPTTVNGSYAKPFAGDLDGNSTDDVFWYAPGDGKDFVWYTSSHPGEYDSVKRSVIGSYVPGSGDFNGNGADDVVWFSPTSAGGDTVWFGDDGATTYSASAVGA